MSVVKEPEVAWSPDQMIEVTLNEPDDFLKVRETLTRIGVASRKEKKIYQSCHILHKQGRYYLVHFKELFALDGKHANLTSNDVQRRNRIAQLLADWGLVGVVDDPIAPLNQIRIQDNIGAKKKKTEEESCKDKIIVLSYSFEQIIRSLTITSKVLKNKKQISRINSHIEID